MRKKEYYKNLAPLNVEDLNMFPKASLHPIIFEEICIKEKGGDNSEEATTETSIAQKVTSISSKKNFHNSNKTHIIVMVHGF